MARGGGGGNFLFGFEGENKQAIEEALGVRGVTGVHTNVRTDKVFCRGGLALTIKISSMYFTFYIDSCVYFVGLASANSFATNHRSFQEEMPGQKDAADVDTMTGLGSQ